MSELTPYDTGARLEPQVWVHGAVTSPNGDARTAVPGDFGRVDFDNDESATIATVYIEPATASTGFTLHITQHTDDYLHVVGAQEPPVVQREDPPQDPDYCVQQGLHLMDRLQRVGEEFDDHVFFTFEGDPNAFEPGHMYFVPAAGRDGSCFAVEERYASPTEWTEYQPVPLCWDWFEYGPARTPEGGTVMRLQAQGTTVPSDIERLIERARSWASEHAERAAAAEALERSRFLARYHAANPRTL